MTCVVEKNKCQSLVRRFVAFSIKRPIIQDKKAGHTHIK